MSHASEGPGRAPRGRAVSGAERDRVIEALCEHYAQDHLEVAEFERRLDRANRVSALDELHALLADLPEVGGGPPAAPGGSQGEGRSVTVPAGAGRVDASRVPDTQTELALFSGRSRTGSWVPARKIRVYAFMGGVELDLREALFGPGEVHIQCVTMMGGIEIIVPPGVRVETGGAAIFGAFDEALEGMGPTPADAPVVRISGLAFMAGVEVHARLPGESGRQARRRIKSEKRAQLERARDREGDR